MQPKAPQLRPLIGPLTAARRRLRLIAVLQGTARLIWTTLVAVIVVGLLDYVLHLPATMRVLCLFGICVYAACALVLWVVRPILSRVPLDVIAAEVEKLNPWLQDRLRSSLSFSEGQTPGSQAMQRAVMDEMVQSLSRVNVADVTDVRSLRRSALAAILPIAVLIALVSLQPALMRIGLDRFLSPTGPAQWPKSVQIELIGALPARVPVGQRMELSARLSRGDRPSRQVIVNWQIGTGPVQQQLMQRNADGTYNVAIDVRTAAETDAEQMKLWIEAGDDRLGPGTIAIVPRLQIRSISATATPPAYCQLQPMSFNLRAQPALVPAGSQMQLKLQFSRALQDVHLEAVGGSESATIPQMTWGKEGNDGYAAAWVATSSFRFRVNARDENGYSNSVAEEFEVISRPDQQPIIQLESPRRSEERTAESLVPVAASVEDDYGISAVALEARIVPTNAADNPPANPASTQPVSLPLVEAGKVSAPDTTFAASDTDSRRHRYLLKYPWKLLTFPSSLLRPGDVIEFQLAARDNYELNGETHPLVKTPTLRITIISQTQLLERVYDELRQVASGLDELRIRQDRLRGDTAQLQQDLAAKGAPDKADEAVAARIAEQQARAASQAKEAALRLAAISTRLAENASPNQQLQNTTANASRVMDAAADAAMKPAANDVKQAGGHDLPKDRRDEVLRGAQKQQRKASEQITQVLDALGDVGGIGRAVDMIQEILTQQRKLTDQESELARANAGKARDDLKKEDRDKLDKAADDQRGLAGQTEAAIEQLRNMSQRQGADDKASAEALRQAAQTGQEQSVAQHQQRASDAISQNQSSQASSSQQSAEAGLTQMLASLKEAQRHKLEQLVRKLISIQEQLQVLVQRQAGHNLDNLALRNAGEGENAALAAELVKKAARTAPAAAATAEQLASSQQQTYRNSTDLVEQMDKVRGANEAAGELGRAGGRMERAVALLRQANLLEAMKPPQTEALAALEQSLDKIKKLLEQNQQQDEADKMEELRKAYTQVREQEVQIRDVTRVLDQSLTAEKKRRSDLVRLNQLSGDQQKLSDALRPLSDQLQDLGSDVFVRTSQEIGQDMVRISAALSLQKTGKPTQMSQSQAIGRLDAIIRALTPPKQDESKYASQSAGGSGGSGGAKKRQLPPVTELVLVRDVQDMVNTQTKLTGPNDGDVLPDLSRVQASVRTSLDQLMAKAAPMAKMPDEKASREPVPEEAAGAPDPNADALDDELLSGAPAGAEEHPDIMMMSRRMTRSQVRLGEQKDPGAVTQVVQAKILKELDKIIDEARKNQSQQQQQQQQQDQQQASKPDPNATPGSNQGETKQGSQNPAQASKVPNGPGKTGPGGDIRETAKEWGGISQRDRQAIIDSAGENIIEKYRSLTEEYYRALANKAAEQK